MPRSIDRDEVVRLVRDAGARVVEVLPAEEYEWAHRPNAIHLHLKDLDADTAGAALDRNRPVIVYCNDFQ